MILSESADLEVIGEAEDGLALLNLLGALTELPDLVILDLSMPRLRGTEAARQIKGLFPNVKVLVLTNHREQEYVRQAMSAGANGYLLKEEASTEIFRAINAVTQGEIYTSPLIERTSGQNLF